MSFHVAPYPIFYADRGTQNLVFFVWILRVNLRGDHTFWAIRGSTMLSGAPQSLAHTSYKSGETLEKQWMFFYAAQNPISHAERVPEILYFVSNLGVNIGRNGKVRAIRGV